MCVTLSIQKRRGKKNSKKFINTFSSSCFCCRGWEQHLNEMRTVEMGLKEVRNKRCNGIIYEWNNTQL